MIRLPAFTAAAAGPSCAGIVLAIALSGAATAARAQEAPVPAAQIEALIPDLEDYVQDGMEAFHAPGLALGIVSGDRLVYANGFGFGKKGGGAVDTATVFQIGSTTKAFLATSIAIAVDKEKLAWDDRVVDLAPGFQMMDPWVTQEFRLFDLLAQRSGMPAYANDTFGLLGADRAMLIHSLRDVEPITSFRSSFAYTNITHMVAQEIVARAMDAPDWETVIEDRIFGPLGMTSSSMTAEAIETAPNTTLGHRWSPDSVLELPFTPIFPYAFGAAGAINSTVDDLSRWVRLVLANGRFEGGEPIVSAANIEVTRTPRVGISPTLAYAMGWVVQSTPNGRIIWHNGGTPTYGSFIGTLPDHDVGVIVLTNLTNVGLPDAIGAWTLDRLLGNPEVDHVAVALERATTGYAKEQAIFDAPADGSPAPLLPPLAGSFEHPSFGVAEVTVDGHNLVLTLAATGARLVFVPWNDGVFAVGLIAEGRFAPIAAGLGGDAFAFGQFHADASGKPNLLTLTVSENGQAYTFVRQ